LVNAIHNRCCVFLNDNILTCGKFNCFGFCWKKLKRAGKVRNVGEAGLAHHIVLARSDGEDVWWGDAAILGKQGEYAIACVVPIRKVDLQA
jgi:hypothetical protein